MNPYSNKKSIPVVFRLTILLLITVLLQACSLFSRALTMEQCQALDTYQIGLRDGQEGQGSAINNIVQQCLVHNVGVDVQGYQRGYEQGLQLFCVPRTAFNLGKQGAIFPAICASVVDVSTLQNEYNRGADLFGQISVLDSQVNAIDAQLNETDNINNQITELERELFNLQREINRDELTPYTRREKRLQVGSIQRQIQTLGLHLRQSAIANSPAVRNDLLRQRESLVAEITRLQLIN